MFVLLGSAGARSIFAVKPVRHPAGVRPKRDVQHPNVEQARRNPLPIFGMVVSLALISVSFGNSQTIQKKLRKDAKQPTLNVIQPKESDKPDYVPKYRRPKDQFFPSPEENRINDARAQQKAMDLYKEVYGIEGTYHELADDFFVSHSSLARRNPMPTNQEPGDASTLISVGTDCSGMDTPIMALRDSQIPLFIILAARHVQTRLRPLRPMQVRIVF